MLCLSQSISVLDSFQRWLPWILSIRRWSLFFTLESGLILWPTLVNETHSRYQGAHSGLTFKSLGSFHFCFSGETNCHAVKIKLDHWIPYRERRHMDELWGNKQQIIQTKEYILGSFSLVCCQLNVTKWLTPADATWSRKTSHLSPSQILTHRIMKNNKTTKYCV